MSDIYGYVYEIRCVINNKFYIGQHKGAYNLDYYGSGLLIRRAFEKYGKDSFERPKIISTAEDKISLCTQEIYWIAEYRRRYGKENVYNIMIGGNGGDIITNNPNRDIINQRRRKSLLGRKVTGETRQKIRLSMIGKNVGKHHTEESKQRISKKLRGVPKKPFSEEHKQNISNSQIGRKRGPFSEEHKQNLKSARKNNPHKINCPCGCCRAKRGENMFKVKSTKRQEEMLGDFNLKKIREHN